MAFRESFESIAGCRVRLMRGGEGPPMLFLHGASGAAQWLPFMERLSQSHDLMVFEHPGFGGSEMPGWLDGIGDLAYFYLDVLDRFELSGVHLVGTSLGGWIAAELAVRNCARLASLTLVAPAGIHVKGLRKGDVFMWSPEQTARNLVHDQALAETMLARQPSPEEFESVLKNRLATARLGWQPRFYNPDLHKWLHRISVPTLIVWGDDDKVIPAGYGPAYRDLVPGARLEVFERCGHLPHVEMADRFADLVKAFAVTSSKEAVR